MNERIRELLKQAGGIQHDEDGDELTAILVGKDLEKFAELIVKECANFLKDSIDDHFAAEQLEDHFGVDE